MPHVYLTRSDIKLGFSQGQLVVKGKPEEEERRFPFCNVESLNVFGSPQISTQLVRECLSTNVPIAYYSEDGHYWGRTICSGNIDPFRQRQQILLTCDAEFCLKWAKRIVETKIKNSLAFLESVDETYTFSSEEVKGLQHSLSHLSQASTADEVMGFEGNAAKCYFQCFSKLFSDSVFSFKGRNSRPPKDPINALLSYGYSFLHRNIIGAIERHGLHPYFGFMHKIKRGHASLASDLIEDYRSFVVDKMVFELVLAGEMSSEDFTITPKGAVYMSKSLMEKVTDLLSACTTERKYYRYAYGDNYRYGFHAALDKKLCSVVDAIEAHDAELYQPFLWADIQ